MDDRPRWAQRLLALVVTAASVSDKAGAKLPIKLFDALSVRRFDSDPLRARVVVVISIIPTGRYEARCGHGRPGAVRRDAAPHRCGAVAGTALTGGDALLRGPDQRPKLNVAFGVITPWLAERSLAPRL